MIPYGDFTPHGYLDNPFHSWKRNPAGVLRSRAPLGMGWHVPNLGSYVRNQFQYTAHLAIGLKIGKTVLVTPDDFKRHKCTIVSHLHTKNRFEYTCIIPKYDATLTIRYFLINEQALGCILTFLTASPQPLPLTCYLMHLHTHNPYTSRLWEHGLYAINGPQEGTALLGLASEGDTFVHGARPAHATQLTFGEMAYVTTFEDAAHWIHGIDVPRPHVTEHEQETGWQVRTVILPFTFTLDAQETGGQVLNAALTRAVSQDQASQYWLDGLTEIAQAEARHSNADEVFWSRAPQLSGNWPAHWQRGLVYDFETLRMVIRPPEGVVHHPFDGMQIQAPRLVLAEAAMDTLFLSYADPTLAAEVLLGHFESAPHPNLPCMREDGSYNMVADDGQICGTAPEWGYPLWCCDQIWRKTGDMQWLRRLYPKAAAYLHWWLEHRCDAEGWLFYACSWESGQDVSSRFGPQQTGGTIIQHVRPVDLQASMAQSATIMARWATLLTQLDVTAPADIDFPSEASQWQNIADEFTSKTHLMWRDGWFRDYDAVAQEWSSQQDVMHLAPIFCGAADWGHIEQLSPYVSRPPTHSNGWAPLCWPPVVMTLVGAAASANKLADAAELASIFIDSAYRSIDRREEDEHGGIPGVTREYHAAASGKWGLVEYVNAGIEGYGWGALSIHLLIRYVLGLIAEDANTIHVAPMLPKTLQQEGAIYAAGPIPWGKHILHVECIVGSAENYTMRVHCSAQQDASYPPLPSQQWEWQTTWGNKRTLQLS